MRKGCPISCAKFQHDPPHSSGCIAEKPQGGGLHQPPPPTWARVKLSVNKAAHASRHDGIKPDLERGTFHMGPATILGYKSALLPTPVKFTLVLSCLYTYYLVVLTLSSVTTSPPSGRDRFSTGTTASLFSEMPQGFIPIAHLVKQYSSWQLAGTLCNHSPAECEMVWISPMDS